MSQVNGNLFKARDLKNIYFKKYTFSNCNIYTAMTILTKNQQQLLLRGNSMVCRKSQGPNIGKSRQNNFTMLDIKY